jgi:hypothetical protein
MMEIDITVARKVLQVVDAGLVSSIGEPIPGKMCVEAAVCYAMGLPHGDQPTCVAPSLRRLKIRLNDARWSSNMARSKGLRRLALAQLGSAGTLDEKEFVQRIARLAIQTQVPIALRAAASICRNEQKKDAMLKAALACELEPTRENAEEACTAAYASAAYVSAAYTSAAYTSAAYAADAADASADYAAYVADASADYAASAADAAAYAADAAYAAAYAANVADVAYAAADAANVANAAYAANVANVATSAACATDQQLTAFAEDVVQILVDMKAYGCEWLVLTESEGGLDEK